MNHRPPGVSHPAFGLAALCALGGGVGLVRGSKVSLVAGLIFGGAFAFAGQTISEGRAADGYKLAMATSSVLSGAMMFRWISTRKVMPAGALALVGAAGAALYYDKLLEIEN
jgi:uncharacterized membrane protein (UPF0136 family)